MTFEEIKAQFDSEWALVGAPDTDEGQVLTSDLRQVTVSLG